MAPDISGYSPDTYMNPKHRRIQSILVQSVENGWFRGTSEFSLHV